MPLDFPHVRQERDWWCLPACIQACLAHLDIQVTQEVITRACATSRAGTTLERSLLLST